MKRSDVKFRHTSSFGITLPSLITTAKVVKKFEAEEIHICNTSRSSEKVLKE